MNSNSGSCPCKDWLGQCQSPAVCSGRQPALTFPGQGMVQGVVRDAKALSALTAWFYKLDASDVISILLGFAFVIIGLFLFRPVQQTVIRAGRAAGKGAALLA